MSDIQEEQIDNDGFLLGDAEQEQTAAQNVLMREIKADTTTIVNLLKGTAKLQRDALKAAQSTASPKPKGGNGNAGSGQSSRVNLLHPNRTTSPTPNNGQGAPIPPTVRHHRQGAGANQPPMPQGSGSGSNTGSPDTARVNRQRGANGRFTGDETQANNEESQRSGNRDSRGRFIGGDGSSAAERSAASRITDSLKDLNNTLSVNANTDRIDPMVDAIKEIGDIASVGIDAGKKVLSVGNTLIAKPAMALGRGIKGLIKPKTDTINSPVAWYKRIWRTLERGNRQDQTQHNQEQRRLDEIARNQGQRGSADGSFLAMLGFGLAGILAALKKGIPKLDELLPEFLKRQDNKAPIPVYRAPKIPVMALPPTRTQSLMMRFGETKVGKALGTVAKKLPLISSMLAAGAGGINAVNIDNDESLTDAQKQRAQSENAGKTVGAIGGDLGGAAAGAVIGTAIMPVVGTILGSIVGSWLGTEGGQIVGEKIGGWVDDLRNADIAGRMTNAWNGFITPFTPMFNEIKTYALGRFDVVGKVWSEFVTDTQVRFGGIMAGLQAVADFFAQIGDFWGGVADVANTWIKQKTGIDVKDNLKRSKNAVNDYAGQKLDQAGQFVGDVGQSVKNTPLVQGVIGFYDGLMQQTAQEKSAKQKKSAQLKKINAQGYNAVKPTMESIYQQAGFNSVEQAFLKGQVQQESNFTADGVSSAGAFGMTQFMPATAKQYGVIKGTTPKAIDSQLQGQANYMSMLKKRYKGDWSKALAAYNYGEGNLDKILAKAKAQGVDWKTLLPNETKDYLVKVGQYAAQFGAPTAAQVAQQKPTTTPSLTPTAKVATNTVPSIKAAPVNAVSTPNVNAIPSVQAKEQPTRHNSIPTPIKVSIAKPLVGQNVSDRGIAHILTGGIGEVV